MSNNAATPVVSALHTALLQRFPEWRDSLRLSVKPEPSVISVPVPGMAGHELSFEIVGRDVIMAYHDGKPPGPAEINFIANESTRLEDFAAAIASHVADLVSGKFLLVREELGRLVKLTRGHDCDSLLSYVAKDEYEAWSEERRARVVLQWSWPAP